MTKSTKITKIPIKVFFENLEHIYMIPFKYCRVVNRQDFYAHQDIISEPGEYFQSAQNVVVMGERRIGKTSLIVETKKRALLSLDLMAIKSAGDIDERIIKSVFKPERNEGFLKILLKIFSNLRPVIGMDPKTTALTVSAVFDKAMLQEMISI